MKIKLLGYNICCKDWGKPNPMLVLVIMGQKE